MPVWTRKGVVIEPMDVAVEEERPVREAVGDRVEVGLNSVVEVAVVDGM